MVGEAGCFWINALSYLAVLASLARITLPPLPRANDRGESALSKLAYHFIGGVLAHAPSRRHMLQERERGPRSRREGYDLSPGVTGKRGKTPPMTGLMASSRPMQAERSVQPIFRKFR